MWLFFLLSGIGRYIYIYHNIFCSLNHLPKTIQTNRNVFSRTLNSVIRIIGIYTIQYIDDYFSKITIRSNVFSLFFLFNFARITLHYVFLYVIDIYLKTCFQHFIRADESWKGLVLVSVQLPCRVKSYHTHTSIYTHVLSFETFLSLWNLLLFYQV